VCSFTFTEAYFCRSASRVAGVTGVPLRRIVTKANVA